jgi:hypothetical protein
LWDFDFMLGRFFFVWAWWLGSSLGWKVSGGIGDERKRKGNDGVGLRKKNTMDQSLF